MKLEDDDRLKLLHLDADQRLLKSAIHTKAVMLDDFLKMVDPNGTVRQLQEEIYKLNRQASLIGEEYRKLCEGLSQRLGIKMNEHAFDIDSGEIITADEARKRAASPS